MMSLTLSLKWWLRNTAAIFTLLVLPVPMSMFEHGRPCFSAKEETKIKWPSSYIIMRIERNLVHPNKKRICVPSSNYHKATKLAVEVPC